MIEYLYDLNVRVQDVLDPAHEATALGASDLDELGAGLFHGFHRSSPFLLMVLRRERGSR